MQTTNQRTGPQAKRRHTFRARYSVASMAAILAVAACSSSTNSNTAASSTGADSGSSAASNTGADSGTSAASNTGADSGTSGGSNSVSQSVQGKNILVVPYWLDNFNQAFTSWLKRDYEAQGATVTVINSNANTKTQLDALDTAISSKKYDGVIWAPVDVTIAPTTIKRLQDAHIPVIISAGPPLPAGTGGVTVPQTINENKSVGKPIGAAAAKFVAEHFPGKPPSIFYVGDNPLSTNCKDREQGFVDGVKAVNPAATVVATLGALNQNDANSKVSNFISRNIYFNIVGSCGGALGLGSISALNAAGRGKAVNKVPQTEWIMTMDASPPELQYLWSPTSSVMMSALVGPKTTATEAEKLLNKVIFKEIAPNADVTSVVPYEPVTSDCAAERAKVQTQYQGVPGFTVPKCTN